MRIACAWLVVVLAACEAGISVAPPASAPVATRDAIVKVDGHTYAVVRVRGMQTECSNAGGTHWTFSVDGMAPDFLLHGGGHGNYAVSTLPVAPAASPRDGAVYYVAEIYLAPMFEIMGGIGWCVGDLPAYQGGVVALVPAPDLASARAQLAAIPTTGFHPAVRTDREHSN